MIRYGKNDEMEIHNEASLPSGLNTEKAMYLRYMISRAFIPPWSLVMRDRKLLDQTLPVRAVGTLVSPSILIIRSGGGKVTKIFYTADGAARKERYGRERRKGLETLHVENERRKKIY